MNVLSVLKFFMIYVITDKRGEYKFIVKGREVEASFTEEPNPDIVPQLKTICWAMPIPLPTRGRSGRKKRSAPGTSIWTVCGLPSPPRFPTRRWRTTPKRRWSITSNCCESEKRGMSDESAHSIALVAQSTKRVPRP